MYTFVIQILTFKKKFTFFNERHIFYIFLLFFKYPEFHSKNNQIPIKCSRMNEKINLIIISNILFIADK